MASASARSAMGWTLSTLRHISAAFPAGLDCVVAGGPIFDSRLSAGQSAHLEHLSAALHTLWLQRVPLVSRSSALPFLKDTAV